MHTGLSLAQACSGLLRPRLHSTQTVSTLLSPTHHWALLWQEDLTVDPSHVWESGISKVGCSAPIQRVTSAGAKVLDVMSKSLQCWPMPMTLAYASEFSTKCQVDNNHPRSNSYLVFYRYGPCVRRFAFTCSIWQTLAAVLSGIIILLQCLA